MGTDEVADVVADLALVLVHCYHQLYFLIRRYPNTTVVMGLLVDLV